MPSIQSNQKLQLQEMENVIDGFLDKCLEKLLEERMKFRTHIRDKSEKFQAIVECVEGDRIFVAFTESTGETILLELPRPENISGEILAGSNIQVQKLIDDSRVVGYSISAIAPPGNMKTMQELETKHASPKYPENDNDPVAWKLYKEDMDKRYRPKPAP